MKNRGRKTLKNLLHNSKKGLKNLYYALPIVGAGLIGGCEEVPLEPEPQKDTIPPKIHIYSPEKNKTYNNKTITLDYLIEEENHKNSGYSINGGEKVNIPQSGQTNITLPENGNYKLILWAEDNSGNSSKDSTYFNINEEPEPRDTIPPEIEIDNPIKNKEYNTNIIPFSGNITDENFSNASYTINDGEKVGIPQSWSKNLDLENGNYRIIVNAKDKEGNSSADTTDFSVNKPTWKYLVNPFVAPNDSTKVPVWNELQTKEERNKHLDDKLMEDKTDTISSIPTGWVCTDYAGELEKNFHGHGELGFDSEKGLENNGDKNIPMYTATLMKPGNFHEVDVVATGDYFANINDLRFINAKNDSTYNLNQFNDAGVYKILVNYTRVIENEIQGKILDRIPMFEFIPDGNNGWKDSGYRNSAIKLIEERE